jgi:hypothetical protein
VKQDYPTLEILVLDDQSIDAPHAIDQQFPCQDFHVKIRDSIPESVQAKMLQFPNLQVA